MTAGWYGRRRGPGRMKVVREWCTDGTVCYRAEDRGLPGCMSHGDTAEEAVTNLVEAHALYGENAAGPADGG